MIVLRPNNSIKLWPAMVFATVIALLLATLGYFGVEYLLMILCLEVYAICIFLILSLGFSGNIISSVSIFFFFYSIYVFFPAIASGVFFGEELQHITFVMANDRIVLVVLLGLVAFTAGVVYTRFMFKDKTKGMLIRYSSKPIVDDLGMSFWLPAIFVLTASLSMTIFYFLSNKDTILDMFLYSLIGAEGRLTLRSGQGLFIMNFVYILPALSLLIILKWRSLEKTNFKKLLGVIAVLIVVFCFLSQAILFARGNLTFYLMMLFLVFHVTAFRLSKKAILYAGVLALVIIVGLTYMRVAGQIDSGQTTSALIFSKIGHRFVTSIAQLGYILDTFPRDGAIPGSTYLKDFLTLLPGPDIGFNGQIYKELGYWGNGTATITILGELYANFWYLGITFGMFVFGVTLQLLHIWLLNSDKKISSVFLYVVLTIYSSKTIIAGVGENFFPVLAVYMPVGAFMLIITYTLRGAMRHRRA